MLRLPTAAAVALLACLGTTTAQDGKALYHPVKEGTVRVYEQDLKGKILTYTDTVTKVVEKNGIYLVTTKREGGKLSEPFTTEFEVSAKGVFKLKVRDFAFTDPTPELVLPAKAGSTWIGEMPGKADGQLAKFNSKVLAEEEVEVPAGKYKAIAVENKYPLGGGGEQTIVVWHAPGVGVVKVENYIGKTPFPTVLKSVGWKKSYDK